MIRANAYACPESLIWTPEERERPELRRCKICGTICQQVFCRIYPPQGVAENLCSKVCWKARVLHHQNLIENQSSLEVPPKI